jgi:serine/threonine-protein kinase
VSALYRLTAALADRYRLERELGQGGMATVYLAEDLKHRRQVAIKVLRPELAAALGAERFLREIETTANLRHPHILPLYDSGEADGFLFYVMPFVEGESLRDRLARDRQLSIDEALQIAREVADALGYAHARGIVHRDIKPENILLESGHAVVADFGIARAVDAAGGAALTQTGVVIGTPQYMSPEQAAGAKDVDGRSDLYTLACVLYEMLAGQPPFTGPTVESVVRQHLAAEPPSITNMRPAVPAAVAEVLRRALAKTPADRFNLVAQFGDALGRAGPTGGSGEGVVTRAGAGRRRWMGPAAAVGAVAVLAVAWALLRRPPDPVPLGRRTQVTHDPGLEIDPALSPDGTFVAYAGAQGTLFVRQVEAGDPVRVIREGDDHGRWPAWTPDGQRLVFLSRNGVAVVPALGGVPRLVAAESDPDRGMALAPDGRSVAYVVHDSLVARPLDGAAPRLVTVGREMHSPSWSADGRWIAFVSGNVQYVSSSDLGNIAPSSVWVVRANGGDAVRVSDDRSVSVSPAWTAAGGLLYVSDHEGSRDVYHVRLSASGRARGAPVRLTTGLNALGIGMSREGTRLVYSSFTETSNAWSLAIPAAGAVSVSQARPVTAGNQTIENIDVSHDGHWLAFSSVVGAVSQIYRQRTDGVGAEPQQLTQGTASVYWSAWSPDDREIALHGFRGERRQVYVVPVAGGTPVPVTDGANDTRSPEWAPDGNRLLLLVNWGTRPELRIAARGADGRWSEARTVHVVLGGDTITPGLSAWSPDGRFLACGCGPGGLVILPVEGGPARRLPSPYSTAGWAFPQWSADGRTVYHVSGDSGRVTAVVAVPVSGERPRVVVRFDDATRPWHRFGFRVRGPRMYFTLGDLQSDIWVAELGRP